MADSKDDGGILSQLFSMLGKSPLAKNMRELNPEAGQMMNKRIARSRTQAAAAKKALSDDAQPPVVPESKVLDSPTSVVSDAPDLEFGAEQRERLYSQHIDANGEVLRPLVRPHGKATEYKDFDYGFNKQEARKVEELGRRVHNLRHVVDAAKALSELRERAIQCGRLREREVPNEPYRDLAFKERPQRDQVYELAVQALMSPVKFDRSGMEVEFSAKAERDQLNYLSTAMGAPNEEFARTVRRFKADERESNLLWKVELREQLMMIDKSTYFKKANFFNLNDYRKWLRLSVSNIHSKLLTATANIQARSSGWLSEKPAWMCCISSSITDTVVAARRITALPVLEEKLSRLNSKEVAMENDVKGADIGVLGDDASAGLMLPSKDFQEQYRLLVYCLYQHEHGRQGDACRTHVGKPTIFTTTPGFQSIPLQKLTSTSAACLAQFQQVFHVGSAFAALVELQLWVNNYCTDSNYLTELSAQLSRTEQLRMQLQDGRGFPWTRQEAELYDTVLTDLFGFLSLLMSNYFQVSRVRAELQLLSRMLASTWHALTSINADIPPTYFSPKDDTEELKNDDDDDDDDNYDEEVKSGDQRSSFVTLKKQTTMYRKRRVVMELRAQLQHQLFVNVLAREAAINLYVALAASVTHPHNAHVTLNLPADALTPLIPNTTVRSQSVVGRGDAKKYRYHAWVKFTGPAGGNFRELAQLTAMCDAVCSIVEEEQQQEANESTRLFAHDGLDGKPFDSARIAAQALLCCLWKDTVAFLENHATELSPDKEVDVAVFKLFYGMRRVYAAVKALSKLPTAVQELVPIDKLETYFKPFVDSWLAQTEGSLLSAKPGDEDVMSLLAPYIAMFEQMPHTNEQSRRFVRVLASATMHYAEPKIKLVCDKLAAEEKKKEGWGYSQVRKSGKTSTVISITGDLCANFRDLHRLQHELNSAVEKASFALYMVGGALPASGASALAAVRKASVDDQAQNCDVQHWLPFTVQESRIHGAKYPVVSVTEQLNAHYLAQCLNALEVRLASGLSFFARQAIHNFLWKEPLKEEFDFANTQKILTPMLVYLTQQLDNLKHHKMRTDTFENICAELLVALLTQIEVEVTNIPPWGESYDTNMNFTKSQLKRAREVIRLLKSFFLEQYGLSDYLWMKLNDDVMRRVENVIVVLLRSGDDLSQDFVQIVQSPFEKALKANLPLPELEAAWEQTQTQFRQKPPYLTRSMLYGILKFRVKYDNDKSAAAKALVEKYKHELKELRSRTDAFSSQVRARQKSSSKPYVFASVPYKSLKGFFSRFF